MEHREIKKRKSKIKNGNTERIEENTDKEQTIIDETNDKFYQLFQKAHELGLKCDDLSKLKAIKDINVNKKPKKSTICLDLLIYFLTFQIIVLCVVLFVLVTEIPVSNETAMSWIYNAQGLESQDESCLISMPDGLSEMVRPPLNCSFCKGVDHIDRHSNISRELFTEKYAHTGRPVVVGKGATQSWTALDNFDFYFFKKLYAINSTALENAESKCQFFPYKTEFNELKEVFMMNDDRVMMKGGSKPWYIGW